jgi:tetratricopeptide (TPR) repeat protein
LCQIVAQTAVIQKNGSDVSALINRGRASLIAWDRGGRTQKVADVSYRVSQDFVKAYETDTFEPLANFYKLYGSEFNELVVEQKKSCRLAYGTEKNAGLYKPVIDLYRDKGIPQANSQSISVYIELGHFLINRDKNYELAELFYKKVPDNDPTRIDMLMGLGNIYYLRGVEKTGIDDFSKSKDFYTKAFDLTKSDEVRRKKLYDLTYNLGALEARLSGKSGASYGIAIQHLKMAFEDSKKVSKPLYEAQRDLAFAYFLDGKYQESLDNFALIPLEARRNQIVTDLLRKYQERANQCKSLNSKQSSTNPLCKVNSDDKRSLLSAGIFGNFIVHESIDPFFDIEHDRFYDCVSNSNA